MKKLVLILLASTFLFAQSEREIDSILNSIKYAKPEDMRKNASQLTGLFASADTAYSKKICNKILNYLAALEDKTLYIRVYLNSSSLYPLIERLNIFRHGYEMAKIEDNEKLMGIAYMMMAYSFKEFAVTDSAMFYALRAKNIFERISNNYDLVHVLLVIADLHYYAGQLAKAEELYKEMLEIKGDPVSWYAWQYSVVLNDLGLVKIEQKKYQEAEAYFNKSLNLLFSRKLNTNDSLRLSYIYRKLLEVNLLKKDYERAEGYYHQALKLAERYNQISELAGIYIGKGELFYASGNYDSALVYFKKGEQCDLIAPDVKSKIDLYRGLTKTYTALKDTSKAYSAMIFLRKARNTADSLFYRANFLTMYAENKYESYLDEISVYKNKQLVMTIFIILILSSLTAFTYFYIRLRTVNKKMVQKNIELVKGYHTGNGSDESNENNHVNSNTETSIAPLGEDLRDQIIEKLEFLMEKEKIFMRTEISLEELAVRLETNRAYLSRAINSKYKMNFNNYINASRIKEAIKIISNGDLKTFTLEGIAQTVGFNNRVSFNKAFHKYTGVTPSFFIKNAEKFT
jgi:YesN/AraC family two-component response regulator